MTTSEKFCLKWNDFQENVSSSIQEIREEFCDVTLAGEGNQKILAHKVILAASSIFFRDILKENPHPHPLLYMKGIKGGQLTSIVDFMYHGEVDVFQEDVNDFIMLAEELQLKGVKGNEKENSQEKGPKINHPMVKPTSRNSTTNDLALDGAISQKLQCFETKVETDKIDEKGELVAYPTIEKKITTKEDLDETIRSMMNRSDGQWICNICGKAGKTNQILSNHIEAKHIEGVSHPCNQCGKLFRSRNSLAVHIFKIH